MAGPSEERAPLLSSEDYPPTFAKGPTNDEGEPSGLPGAITAYTSMWKAESKLVIGYSLPLITTYLLQYSYSLVTIYVVGHLGTTELASVSLGITTMNIIGYAIFEGFATSLDTLCSQAYGSAKNPHLVGVHIQRMFLLLMIVAIPIALLWVFSPYLLVHMVPDPQLAVLAGTFLRSSLVSIPGYSGFEVGKRFLQAQGDFTGGLVALVVSAPLLIFFNWLLVSVCHLGVAGAALAAAITTNFRPLILLFYVKLYAPWTLQCWPGLLPASVFKNWKPMVFLSIPSVFLIIFEWLSFEIMTFSTSYLGNTQLAAQTILSTTAVIMWHIPFSASIAVSTRIGQLIGAGDVGSAKRNARVYVVIFLFIAAFNCCVVLVGREFFANVFTTDPEVRAIILHVIVMVAAFEIFDSTASCMQGIVRGLGRQKVGAWVTLFINYAYALPLALILELGVGKAPTLGLFGLWGSLASGLAFLTVALGAILKLIDWQHAVDEAREREEPPMVETTYGAVSA